MAGETALGTRAALAAGLAGGRARSGCEVWLGLARGLVRDGGFPQGSRVASSVP